MSEIMEHGIHIYTGEIDEEDDSSEIRDLKVSYPSVADHYARLILLSAGVSTFLDSWQQHITGSEWQAGAWATLPLGRGGGGK